MVDIIAAQDLYMNADQDTCVTLESGEAAFLLARKGRMVPRTHTEFVTKAGNPDEKEKQPSADKEQKPVADKEPAAEDTEPVKKTVKKTVKKKAKRGS